MKNQKKEIQIKKVFLCEATISRMTNDQYDVENVPEKKEGICIALDNLGTLISVFIPLDILAESTYEDTIARIKNYCEDPTNAPELPLIVSHNIQIKETHLVHNYDESATDNKDKLTFPNLLEAMKYAKWCKKNKNKPVYYVISASGEYFCSTQTVINDKRVVIRVNDWRKAREDLILCHTTDLRELPIIIDHNEDVTMYRRRPNIIKNSGTEYTVKKYSTNSLMTVLQAKLHKKRTKKR